MKLVRFVTKKELDLYLSGARIVNRKRHAISGFKTTSVGACFAELTPERDPDKWLRKLFFNITCEYCIEFDSTQFKELLIKSQSIYSADDPEGINAGKRINVREWCLTSYSIDTHPYLRIGKCPTLADLCAGKKIEWLDPTSVLMAK